jgi:transposase InsO family protein
VIAIDHKGPLPRTKFGNRYITVIIDRFTNYVVCIPIPRINAYTTAWNIINHWIVKFGVPYGILSDQGSDFMSGIIKALYYV